MFNWPLSKEEISLLLANTSFTRDEIHKWHEGFIKDCPKGQLDKKKFVDAYKVVIMDEIQFVGLFCSFEEKYWIAIRIIN